MTDMVGEEYAPGFLIVGAELPTSLPIRYKLSTFYACNGCEYCEEVHRVALREGKAS